MDKNIHVLTYVSIVVVFVNLQQVKLILVLYHMWDEPFYVEYVFIGYVFTIVSVVSLLKQTFLLL